MQHIAGYISPYAGLVFTFVIFCAVIIVTRVVVRKKQFSPYSRQVITGLIVLLGMFIGVLTLPVSNEARGQILSLMGILVSAVIALSSTNLMGNAMAGIMLRLSRSFRPGDFIEVEETRGRIFQQGLFTTQVQIISRDVINFPNLYLIQKSFRVINRDGSFISAPVSLGYDCGHQEVEDALKKAAESCGLKDGFVYIEDLLDHAVVYRVYGLLDDYTKNISAVSDLRKAMLDKLHENGIEIVSPSYVNRRELDMEFQVMPSRGTRSPDKSPDLSEKEKEEIEKKAFDKAEKAADLEQMKEDYQALVKEMETCKENKKTAHESEEKKRLTAKIETLAKKQQRLQEMIDAVENQHED